MEFENERFGKCVTAEITQKQLEDYLKDMQGKGELPLTAFRGDAVRNAIKHKLIVEPEMKVGDVDQSKPGLICWLEECISGAIKEATNIDPLSS